MLGCSINSCSFTASSIAFSCWTHLLAISSMSSTSDVSSVQYLQRIFASSPTLTLRVIMHNEMNDMINNDDGTPKNTIKWFHVVSKSKRASTFDVSTCKYIGNRVVVRYIGKFDSNCIKYWFKSLWKTNYLRLEYKSFASITHLMVEAWVAWLCGIVSSIATIYLKKSMVFTVINRKMSFFLLSHFFFICWTNSSYIFSFRLDWSQNVHQLL